jgi:hypothetical protein
VAPPKWQRRWKVKDPFWNAVEIDLSGRWLSRSPVIRIGLACRVNLSRILQNFVSL